jgi:hypothetical protein
LHPWRPPLPSAEREGSAATGPVSCPPPSRPRFRPCESRRASGIEPGSSLLRIGGRSPRISSPWCELRARPRLSVGREHHASKLGEFCFSRFAKPSDPCSASRAVREGLGARIGYLRPQLRRKVGWRRRHLGTAEGEDDLPAIYPSWTVGIRSGVAFRWIQSVIVRSAIGCHDYIYLECLKSKPMNMDRSARDTYRFGLIGFNLGRPFLI